MGRGSAFIFGVLVGAAFGASLALLYAPQSGEDTRRMIGEKTSALRDKARSLAEDARERVRAATARFRSAGDAETA